jgi:DNA-binding NtrC family response regulator
MRPALLTGMVLAVAPSWRKPAVKAPPPRPERTCLIGEDVALIGLALETYLEEQGFVCETVSSTAQGLERLQALPGPAVAVLDYQLADGPCTPLLSALKSRGVPAVIYSGHARRQDAPELRDVTWIGKPARREVLLEAVTDLLAKQAA